MTFNVIKNTLLFVSVSTFVYPSALPSAESLYHEPAALITLQVRAVPSSDERLSPTDSYRIVGIPSTSELRVYLTCSKYDFFKNPFSVGHSYLITEFFDENLGSFDICGYEFANHNGLKKTMKTSITKNASSWRVVTRPLRFKKEIERSLLDIVVEEWRFEGADSLTKNFDVLNAAVQLSESLEKGEWLGDVYGVWGRNCLLLCSEIIKKTGVDPEFKVMGYSNAPVVDADYRVFYQKTAPNIMDYSRVIVFGFMRDMMFMAALLPYKFFWDYVMGYKVPLKTRSNPVDGLQKKD